MAAVLSFPPPKNYQGPLLANPALWRKQPNEGDKVVPVPIDWATTADGGNNRCVLVDIGSQIVSGDFSQMVAVYVDNLSCEADVQLIFSNDQARVTIPALSSELVYVPNRTTHFVAYAPSAANTDVTYLQVFNSYPPPVALAKTEFVSNASAAGIALTTSNTQVIANTVNGILAGFDVSVRNVTGGAAAGQWDFSLQDGNGVVLGVGGIGVAAAGFVPQSTLLRITGINQRFMAGIVLVGTFSGTAFGGGVGFCNAYTR